MSWVRRLRGVLRRNAVETEMQEEMRQHLEAATERLIARGLTPSEAAVAARREFGNVGVIQEEARDIRGWPFLSALLADIRFAFRYFRRTPLTTATIVLILSLGLGVCSALFSFGQAVMYRPAPGVTTAKNVVRVQGTATSPTRSNPRRDLSWVEYQEVLTETATFSELAAWSDEPAVATWPGGGETMAVTAEFVTTNLLPLVGAKLALGRSLPAHDDLNTPAMETVITDGLWRSQFGGDSSAIGRTFSVNGIAVTLVGVLSPPFRGVESSDDDAMLWLPFSARSLLLKDNGAAFASRDSSVVQVVGRLAPGINRNRADAILDRIGERSNAQMTPSEYLGVRGMTTARLGGLPEVTNDRDLPIVIGLFGGGALLILLIVCTNVSALIVGAGVARRQEIAIRLSLGASRMRIVRQLVTESIVLSLGAGLLGLLILTILLRVLASMVDGWIDIRPDLLTILFTVGFAVVLGTAFGLSPAFHATHGGTASALKGSARTSSARTRLQRGFLVAQIALTQPLLVLIGVLVVLGGTSWAQHGGTNAEARAIRVRPQYFGGDEQTRTGTLERAKEALLAYPGVTMVIPGPNGYSNVEVMRVDSSDRPLMVQRVRTRSVVPGYIKLSGMSLELGRDFEWQDSTLADQPVIVSREFATMMWGSRNPIGERLRTGGNGVPDASSIVVVGVTEIPTSTGRPDQPTILVLGRSAFGGSYLVGTAGEAAPMIPDLQRLLYREAPAIPFEMRTLEDLTNTRRTEMFQVVGASAGGGVLALILASIGLYGVVALMVGQRRREIGIRMAVGAMPQNVVLLIMRRGLGLGVLGIVLGLPLSLVALKVIPPQIDMPKVDPLPVGIAVGLAVLGVAAFASWLPARRAARIAPIEALRSE